MKVIAYTALLYGRDYLGYAIRSVIDAVDEHHILYTPYGSHGSTTTVPCPETREELYAIARDAAGAKLRWHDGRWTHEGEQRDSIQQYVPDADVILVVDADEIWSEGLANQVVDSYCMYQISPDWTWNYQRLRVPMVHAWRSFRRWVIHDPAFPERIIYPKEVGKPTATLDEANGRIFHFGYAQRPAIVEYKQLTHGHKAQWRTDVDWFHDKFMANAQTDCHPVGSEYWNPETIDPFALGLPEFLREHEYANLQVIGDVT